MKNHIASLMAAALANATDKGVSWGSSNESATTVHGACAVTVP